MLDVAKKPVDPFMLLRLNTIPYASNAIENDVQYHLKCWQTESVFKKSLL